MFCDVFEIRLVSVERAGVADLFEGWVDVGDAVIEKDAVGDDELLITGSFAGILAQPGIRKSKHIERQINFSNDVRFCFIASYPETKNKFFTIILP